MRKIKFRAWSTYGTAKHMVQLDPQKKPFESDYLISARSWAVMQYTGLLDKNGVEIYEGDIVRSSDKLLAKVEYITPEFVAFWEDRDDKDFENLLVYNEDIEVIGNIYENSDLLDGKA